MVVAMLNIALRVAGVSNVLALLALGAEGRWPLFFVGLVSLAVALWAVVDHHYRSRGHISGKRRQASIRRY